MKIKRTELKELIKEKLNKIESQPRGSNEANNKFVGLFSYNIEV